MKFDQDMKIKTGILVAVIVVVVVVAIAYLWKDYDNHNKPQYKPGPTIVLFTKAKQVSWQPQFISVGNISAKKGVMLNSDAEGRILHIFVQSGEVVKKGQKLFEVDPKALKAILQQNLSVLALSKLNYERYKQLNLEGAATQEAYDQAVNKYNIDHAAVEKTKRLLDLTMIRAPFSGVFGLTKVHLGDVVKIGDLLGYLQTQKDLYVQFSVPGSMVGQLKIGSQVDIYSPQFPNQKILGNVYAIDSSVDPDTQMIDVRATVMGALVIPGSYAEIALNIGQAKKVMVLPQVAVVSSVNGDYVYKVVNGKAVQTFVKTGERRGDLVEITKGLSVGDTVVNGGQIKVLPGAAVTDKGAIQLGK